MSELLTFPEGWAAPSEDERPVTPHAVHVLETLGGFLRAMMPAPNVEVAGLRRASEVEVTKVDYIWHDRFVKGAVAVIGGPSGKGKSLATAKIAADVSTGRGMPNRQPGAVIVSNREDAIGITRGRVEVAGGDLDRVYFTDDFGDIRPYSIPEDVDRLERDVVALNAKMVILDTAAKHLTAPIRNDQKVAQALAPLSKMAERTGCTILFVTHTLKHVARNTDPLGSIGGATGGLVGTARCVALFGVTPSNIDHRGIAWVKNSYGPVPKGMVFSIESDAVYDENGRVAAVAGFLSLDDADADIDPIALVASKADAEDGQGTTTVKRAAAAEWLTDKLKDGPVAVADLKVEADHDGISWGTVRRAEEGIGIEKPREGFGKGSTVFWRLPDDHPALNVPAAQNKTPGGK